MLMQKSDCLVPETGLPVELPDIGRATRQMPTVDATYVNATDFYTLLPSYY